VEFHVLWDLVVILRSALTDCSSPNPVRHDAEVSERPSARSSCVGIFPSNWTWNKKCLILLGDLKLDVSLAYIAARKL